MVLNGVKWCWIGNFTHRDPEEVNKLLMKRQREGTKLYGFKFEQQKTQNYPANKVNKMHYTLDIGKTFEK